MRYSVRLAFFGCTNRPFYHIVVAQRHLPRDHPGEETLGTFDPLPNKYNEKLVSINFQRLKYWLANGAEMSPILEKMIGLSGFLPIHPRTYLEARRNRKAALSDKLQQNENTDN